MAAEKKGQTIVIKKIYVVAGHHGGSWKVALADFMTAMMAFFLVMWLLNQSEETKKAVSDYFSTPSVIEYNFQNFGAVITLEKLFLDLLNEPMKAFQSFLEPADKTPNLLDMGSQQVVAAFMADKLGDMANNVQVNADGYEFEIPDRLIFAPGTSTPLPEFVKTMDRLKTILVGLEDSQVEIVSQLFQESVKDSDPDMAKRIANQRLDIIQKRIESSLEHASNEINGVVEIRKKRDWVEGQSSRPGGVIRISARQKKFQSSGKPVRRLEKSFGAKTDVDMTTYESYVKEISELKKR